MYHRYLYDRYYDGSNELVRVPIYIVVVLKLVTALYTKY